LCSVAGGFGPARWHVREKPGMLILRGISHAFLVMRHRRALQSWHIVRNSRVGARAPMNDFARRDCSTSCPQRIGIAPEERTEVPARQGLEPETPFHLPNASTELTADDHPLLSMGCKKNDVPQRPAECDHSRTHGQDARIPFLFWPGLFKSPIRREPKSHSLLN
jgi:hypothetical protein